MRYIINNYDIIDRDERCTKTVVFNDIRIHLKPGPNFHDGRTILLVMGISLFQPAALMGP